MPYRAPVSDFRFLMDHVVGFDEVAATDLFADATPDMTQAILTEGAKMCEEILAPLNRAGDLPLLTEQPKPDIATPDPKGKG